MSPLIAYIIDKKEIKKPLILSIILFDLAIVSMYWFTNSIWHLYFMYFLLAIVGAGTTPVGYSKTIINWFDKHRGLALGIGLAGVGIGTALIPKLSQSIIDTYGWGEACLAIGTLVLLISLPTISYFFADRRSDKGLFPDNLSLDENIAIPKVHSVPTGLSVKETIIGKYYWLMMFAFFFLGLTLTAIIVHLISLLIGLGVSPSDDASIAAPLGIALLFGRVLAGYLMDRYFAPMITVLFLLCPVVGLALFATGATGALAVISTMLIGLVIGAEFDVIAFFISRYIRSRSFG
jgi:MFS family permease